MDTFKETTEKSIRNHVKSLLKAGDKLVASLKRTQSKNKIVSKQIMIINVVAAWTCIQSVHSEQSEGSIERNPDAVWEG